MCSTMPCSDFIEQQESRYQAIFEPLHFISNNRDSVSISVVVSVLQDLMHTSLTEYLGAGWMYPYLERRSYLYPYHVESYILRGLLEMSPILDVAEKRFGLFGACRTKLDDLGAQMRPLEAAVAALYKAFYDEFEAVTEMMPVQGVSVKPACREFRLDEYPPDSQAFLGPLEELAEALLPFRNTLCGFYLHGSLATGDFVPYWSDVDTLVVVRSGTFHDLTALVELRHALLSSFRHFFAIDSLQLHGYFVISESDLCYYPQTYFPLVLFGYARSFYPGDPVLQVRVRDSQREALQIFWRQAKAFAVRAAENRYNFQTVFERKVFLHAIFSFPLFFLQAKGEHYYKRDSFGQARAALPNDWWNAVDIASDIMRSWDHAFRLNRWTSAVGRANVKLWMKMLNVAHDSPAVGSIDAFELLDRHAEELVQGMGKLSVCAWEAVRDEADACLSSMGVQR